MADPTVRVQVALDDTVWAEAVEVLKTEGWREEEGIRILLGYGFTVHEGISQDDLLHALGAARAELATLRHRAFTADEAIRSLEMNVTGLTASIAQGQRSLEALEGVLTSLRTRVQEMTSVKSKG